MRRLPAASTLAAGLAAGCILPGSPPPAPLQRVAAVPPASAAPPAVDGIGLELLCIRHGAYGRFEAYPRSPALDGAIQAFDQAQKNYEEGRYLAAGRDFMAAATRYLAAEDLQDRRWSYQNAARAFAVANAVGEGRAALLRAADHDRELATDIRGMVRELERDACVGRYETKR